MSTLDDLVSRVPPPSVPVDATGDWAALFRAGELMGCTAESVTDVRGHARWTR